MIEPVPDASGPHLTLLVRRARQHRRYGAWIHNDVIGWIYGDRGGPAEVAALPGWPSWPNHLP